MISKEAHFAKEMKLAAIEANTLDKRKDYNTKKDYESAQTKECNRSRPKNVNTKTSKTTTSKKH